MRKKILSVMIAAVIAGTIAPIMSTVPTTAKAAEMNQGIRFDPNAYNFTVKENTVIHAEAKDKSLVIGMFTEGKHIKDYGQVTDENNEVWVKVKVLDNLELYGYVKKSSLGVIYY